MKASRDFPQSFHANVEIVIAHPDLELSVALVETLFTFLLIRRLTAYCTDVQVSVYISNFQSIYATRIS